MKEFPFTHIYICMYVMYSPYICIKDIVRISFGCFMVFQYGTDKRSRGTSIYLMESTFPSLKMSSHFLLVTSYVAKVTGMVF